MPQEAWVVKCYSCKKYQVQLEKKAKKWKCVVCGSKQDLMKIFFKGSPKDCRLNVQNMNAAEGEMLEKMHEQSQYQSNYDDNWENVSQNSQEYSPSRNYGRRSMAENFEDDAMADIIGEQCFETAICSKELDDSKRIDEGLSSNSREELEKEDQPSFQSEDLYDVNSIDFTIKTTPSDVSSRNRGTQVLKLSIFESNAEFDESLDF